MKIKTKPMDYDAVLALPRAARRKPRRPSRLLREVIRLAGAGDLKATHFRYTTEDMEKLGDGPVLVLMNHSAFIDLEIASRVLWPRPYTIVCTSDGFVGKDGLLRAIGCIPTLKFVTDVGLIGDMRYALHELGDSVLLYPEASYSFDGCQTPLPAGLGLLLKKLDVPVMMIRTYGAFQRDPLYNCLQKRQVDVSAAVRGLFSLEEVRDLSVRQLTKTLEEAFTFDNFAWQRENGVRITEPFRADGLNRILFRCPACGAEGRMEGKGTGLTCHACQKRWELDELGSLRAEEGETEFPHIPDWYAWERETVRQSLLDGSYRLDVPVQIGMMVDHKAIYMVGEGRLRHDGDGFLLTGCGGRLEYRQSPLSSYGLYADYYWYEIGDVICIGNADALYYCFPKDCGDVVAKTRMAAEELYKLRRSELRGGK